jgi:hypothetical protein
MWPVPEGEDPAPLAAGRASNMFSSAGEQSEGTQGHRRNQVAEATRPSVPASPTVVSVCDDLRFEAIIEASKLPERYRRSAGKAAWRSDRLTLRTHLRQLRPSAVTAIQVFKRTGNGASLRFPRKPLQPQHDQHHRLRREAAKTTSRLGAARGGTKGAAKE